MNTIVTKFTGNKESLTVKDDRTIIIFFHKPWDRKSIAWRDYLIKNAEKILVDEILIVNTRLFPEECNEFRIGEKAADGKFAAPLFIMRDRTLKTFNFEFNNIAEMNKTLKSCYARS